jgi:hypothetical protein
MNWTHAKTIIIVAFALLNIALGTLLFMENRRYTLQTERIDNIMAVLNAHGINMYTMPMRRFPPMRRLDVGGFHYDAAAMAAIFFAGEAEAEHGEEYYYFFTDTSAMIISGGFVFYETWGTPWITSPQAFISEHFPNFHEDITFTDPDGVRTVFLEQHRGVKVESNRIEFLITPHGVTEVEMAFGHIIGHGGDERPIFAPDEALLTFMQRWAPMATIEPIFILSMELVYYVQHASNLPGQVYHAVPHYRIFIEGNDDHPILINAFTNIIVD